MKRFGRYAEVRIKNQFREKTFTSNGFRMRFDVRHTIGSVRGSIGKIEIFNLSAETEDDLLVRNTECELKAGHKDMFSTIYLGSIMRVERGREDVDRFLRIHLRVGIQLEQTIMIALGGANSARTAVKTIIDALKRDMIFEGVELDESSLNIIPQSAIVRNWSFTGPARLALDELLAGFTPTDQNYRLSWDLVGTTISIVSTNKGREFLDTGNGGVEFPPVEQKFKVSETNGLIGLPEKLEAGIRTKVLLTPAVKTNQLMEVLPPMGIRGEGPSGSASSLGFYVGKQWRTVAVRHSGDTWGGDYYTEIEGRILD